MAEIRKRISHGVWCTLAPDKEKLEKCKALFDEYYNGGVTAKRKADIIHALVRQFSVDGVKNRKQAFGVVRNAFNFSTSILHIKEHGLGVGSLVRYRDGDELKRITRIFDDGRVHIKPLDGARGVTVGARHTTLALPSSEEPE